MATTDNPTTTEPWARYCLLMECRHINRVVNDPEGRRWEREHAAEITQLEDRNPDFILRYCQKAIEDARAAAPDTPPPIRVPRHRPMPDRDWRSRQANDG